MTDLVETVKENLEERTKRNISMTSVPIPVIKDFKHFCKEECGDVYAVGLQQLLKTKKLYENIIPLLSSILQELNQIKAQKVGPLIIHFEDD